MNHRHLFTKTGDFLACYLNRYQNVIGGHRIGRVALVAKMAVCVL
jgi:hypothetical protein